ncbi:PglZ domain-containing protein [Hymenobacter sp. BT664]|uniref:PglZ domain-containing protein n=1 Tax=Hymenobacter montanus TaxID=2771359 RepID=A0A927BG44_9BACT|nr:PglZ domain-containing protein [Hymenobacter montanus]MBD2769382.1 PglZ domain-containing protein [Hymenobacter montanus]
MPTIRAFIQNQIQQKLTKRRCVVVYDPAQLYGELVAELAGPAEAPQAVIVAALPGPTQALLTAWAAWASLGSRPSPGPPLVVYVAAAAPQGEAAQRADPFWALAVAGSTFGCTDDEQYAQLARQCYPDHTSKLAELFSAPQPPAFAVLDNLGGGERWPLLSHYLPGRESRAELLRGLLLPSASTDKRLLEATDWISEAQRLVEVALGVLPTENTLPTLRRKLWQLVLLGEFVFDLRCPLPPALTGVARAADRARDLVLRLADELRHYQETEYLEQARQLADQLNLSSYFGPDDDLGERLTFGFEDLTLLGQVLTAIRTNDLSGAAAKLKLQKKSVWRDQGAARWELTEAGLGLLQAVNSARAYLQAENTADLARLVAAYVGPLHLPDAAQRHFEAAVAAYQHSPEALPTATGRPDGASSNLEEFIQECRSQYATLAVELHQRLLTAVEKQGWPATGLPAARELTNQLVQPALQDGRRIAYFLVDALRFELAQEVAGLLSEQGATVQIQPYCAQLPTSTPIGMSALLPHDGTWTLATGPTGKVEPQAGQPLVPVPDVGARDKFWEQRFGDRVRVLSQETWLSTPTVPATVRLLVVRSSDLDQAGEHRGIGGVGHFPLALRALRKAVLAAGTAGFREIIIVTDHGFVLNPSPDDGALVPVPAGEWPFRKVRSLLGRGPADTPGTIRFDSAQVSIPGPWPHFVVPRSLGAFERGITYAHEGLSLPEVVLPALRIQLPAPEQAPKRTNLFLTYPKTAVTTRQPILTAEATAGGLLDFDDTPPVEFQLVVVAADGRIVGKLGLHTAVVDVTTQLVRLSVQEKARLPVRLDEEFEGIFTVRALHPDTQVELASITLQTAYEI